MNHPVYQALWLMLPVVVAGALHMAVVKCDALPRLKVPIHAALFGANKTWRGFVVMPVACLVGLLVSHHAQGIVLGMSLFDDVSLLGLGVLLGWGYCLGELPNSYVKRRLGIPPGKSVPSYRALTLFTDHLDSLLGCLAVYALLLDAPLAVFLWILLLGPLVHITVNLALYAAGLRREAF
jgi:hypothetical protein